MMRTGFETSGAVAAMPEKVGDSERLEYRHPGVRMHFWAGGFPTAARLRPSVHWHDNFELTLVTDGTVLMLVGGESIRLEKGDFLFINSGPLHKLCQAGAEAGRYCMAIIHPSLVGCEEGLMREAVEPLRRRRWMPFVILRRGHTGKIPDVFARMLECESRPDAATPMEAAGLALELWAAMLRAFQNEGALAPDAGTGHTPRKDEAETIAVRAMVSFVQSQYGERLTLSKIASAGRVCRSSCCELFARHLGQSPVAYLNEFRLETARRLLRESRDPIADVAFACGFSNQSYFTRLFKIRFGETPFRARQRENAQGGGASGHQEVALRS